MLVLGFDTETTGVDVTTANILELGAVLFDVNDGIWKPLEEFSTLVFDPSYLPLPKDALDVNGITEEQLRESGLSFLMACEQFRKIASKAEYLIAHNEPFDSGIVKYQCEREGVQNPLANLKRLCSLNDIEVFHGRKCRKLSHLALDFGIIVDPSKLHRAIGDVLLMGELLSVLKIDPAELEEYRNSPSVIIQTPCIPPWEDGGRDKDDAVREGYRWENAGDKKFPKAWVKQVKKTKLPDEKRKYRILEEK